jgi:putative transposase
MQDPPDGAAKGPAVKTLEFGLYPTKAQAQQLEAWLVLQRRVWNYGLALLEELHAFTWYDKASKARVRCSPMPWSYRWEKDGDSWQAIPYSPIRTHRKAGLSCPIPQSRPDDWQPRLANDSYFTLCAFFAKQRHPNWPELQGCPNNLIRGALKALATSWTEYRKGKRKPPRFKSARFPIVTLSDQDCKKSASVNGDTVKLPTLGTMRIKGNSRSRRWPSDRTVATFRIQREPSGWFLLLVGEVPAPAVRRTSHAVGIDAGVVHTMTTSTGKHIDAPPALEANLRRLKRLQQRMARQQKGGSNWRRTVAAIARLHERIRRTRKLFSHKATTFLLRTYGTVVVEDLKLQNMTRKPAAKPSEDGQGFQQNGAKAKGTLNRRILDQGLGQLRTMLEAKALDHGRVVHRVSPHFTSQTCGHCGCVSKANRQDQAHFRCTSCGFSGNADVNAAVNILRIALPSYVVPNGPAPLVAGSHQLQLVAPAPSPVKVKASRARKPAAAAPAQLALL